MTKAQDKTTRAQALVLQAARASKGWPHDPDTISRHLAATARRQPHVRHALVHLGIKAFVAGQRRTDFTSGTQ